MTARIRRTICGIPVDAITMEQTLNLAENAIQEKKYIHHSVINAAKVVNAIKNPDLKKSIVDCDIINADGKAIVWAARFLNRPVPERVTGIDLMGQLVKLAAKRQFAIYFFGATEDVVQKVVQTYSDEYGAKIIAGYCSGYFTKAEEPMIAKKIAASEADILFVAMTSPRKEIFLETYKQILKVPFIMGVGGSFDVVAGVVKRAPLWMQSSGLEWLYRVIQEPGRLWKRYLITNSLFIYLILKEKFFSFKIHPKNHPSPQNVSPSISTEKI
jgi:N-acetylglucosaminyldiphosphoundecaprenol N-acetyl-beta-D-mannosaminyltransferase